MVKIVCKFLRKKNEMGYTLSVPTTGLQPLNKLAKNNHYKISWFILK